MYLSLPPNIQRLIDDRLASGQYASAEAVVAAALSALDHVEHPDDFEPAELDQLLDEGEKSGERIEAEQVFAELRSLSDAHRRGKAR